MMRDGTEFSCWLIAAGMALSWMTSPSLPPLSVQENRNELRGGSTSLEGDNRQDLPTADNINSLIQMLGADDYSTRVLAEKRLMKVGGPAIAPLKKVLVAGQTQIESEIRFRAERLLILLEREDYKSRRHEFLGLEDGDPRELGFFGWRQFSTVCSSNRRSRQMFLGMYQSHPQLFQSLELGKAAVESRIKAETTSAFRETNAAQIIDSINTMMFFQVIRFDNSDGVGIDLGGEIATGISRVLNRADTVAFVRRGDHRSEIESLIEAWLNQQTIADGLSREPSSSQPSSIDARLKLTRNYRLFGQSQFLFGLIENHDLPVQTRAKSLEVLSEIFSPDEASSAIGRPTIGGSSSTPTNGIRANRNSETDNTKVQSGMLGADEAENPDVQLRRQVVNRLQPILADATLFGHFPNSEANLRMLEIQFCDLVLAACVKISDAEMNDLDWGYEHFLDSSLKKRRFGFANDSMRKKAKEKWLLLYK